MLQTYPKIYRIAALALAWTVGGAMCVIRAQEKPDAPMPKVTLPSALPVEFSVEKDLSRVKVSEAEATETQSQPQPAQDQKPSNPPANASGQQDDNPKRILDIIPNFQTKNDTPENQKPMTVKEKYALAWHQSVDFSAHVGNAFQAMLQQASNGQPHYGQGWGAYAERFGAAEADQVTSSFFIFGFLPHILHDDPRYFRRAKGPIFSRIVYAASRTVITRTDSGRSTFNVPQVAGQLFQQAISTSYYPPVDRSVSGVFQNWGVNLSYNCAYNVLKEFYPDFLRIVFHRHNHAQSTAADTH